jgi:hypothetical protein
MKSMRLLSLFASFVVALVSWNGCLMGGGGKCEREGVPPVNVTATAGDGSVALSWRFRRSTRWNWTGFKPWSFTPRWAEPGSSALRATSTILRKGA